MTHPCVTPFLTIFFSWAKGTYVNCSHYPVPVTFYPSTPHTLPVFFPAPECISMLTQPQHLLVGAGDQVLLQCEFHAAYFNLFDNPTIWIKKQDLGRNPEMTDINIMGNIKPPFLATGRFDVNFKSEPPRYFLELSITSKYYQTLPNSFVFLYFSHLCVSVSQTYYRDQLRIHVTIGHLYEVFLCGPALLLDTILSDTERSIQFQGHSHFKC